MILVRDGDRGVVPRKRVGISDVEISDDLSVRLP